MIINNSLDEVKKRENALSIIKNHVETKGRSSLFDLTGLAGGFIASEAEISLLETYVGPAIFEDAIQEVGKEHMGGDKVLAVNRTSSGILATILSLVSEGSNVVHYLAELPAHPSIPRSCKLVGAEYFETDVFEEFTIPDNTSLVVVTGSTMDHKVIDEDEFRQVIEMAHAKNIPVMVDDASGARLRTVVYNQPKACDLGADISITSTDKLMAGPRGGLMAGREDLIDDIVLIDDVDAINMSKRIAKEFGLGIGISSGANFLASVLVNKDDIKVATVFADDNKKYITTKLSEPIDDDENLISNKVKLISFEVI